MDNNSEKRNKSMAMEKNDECNERRWRNDKIKLEITLKKERYVEKRTNLTFS